MSLHKAGEGCSSRLGTKWLTDVIATVWDTNGWLFQKWLKTDNFPNDIIA